MSHRLAIALAILAAFPGSLSASDNAVDFGSVVKQSETAIVDKHDVCKKVTNGSDSDVLIPAKKNVEWSVGLDSFLSHISMIKEMYNISVESCDEPAAQPYSLTRLLASDKKSDRHFGNQVSISGDTVVVGDRESHMYIYERGEDGFFPATETYKFTGPKASFGRHVSIDGDVIITGKYGGAHVFERQPDSTWAETQYLQPCKSCSVGDSVDVSGDYIILGAEYLKWGGTYAAGAAYIFEKQPDGTWLNVVRLTDPNKREKDYFGSAVAIDGNTAVVSSPHDNGKYKESGTLFIYERDAAGTWNFVQQIYPTATSSTRQLGDFGLDISGDFIIAGSVFDDSRKGSAYVWRREPDGTWVLDARLLPDKRNSKTYFGKSAAISGNIAVVGSLFDSEKKSDSGAAYVFKRQDDGTWVQDRKIKTTDIDISKGDTFGYYAAIDGTTAVISKDHYGNYQGAAYVASGL
jgi:ketosteroid isomerase-like protein